MSGITKILEMGRDALMAQRTALDVTSNNISNADSIGYSRQKVILQPNDPIKLLEGQLGTGVLIKAIQRQRSVFIDSELRKSGTLFGEADSQSQLLSRIEAIINEPSDSSIATALGNFFDSYETLSTNPEEVGLRQSVVQSATTLAQQFNLKYQSLQSMKLSLSDDATNKIDEINNITRQIAQLNKRIIEEGAAGGSPNDLMDKRDSQVDDLAKLVGIKVSEDPAGAYNISIGGTLVVSRAGSVDLALGSDGEQLKVVTKNAQTGVKIMSGELSGILQTRNETIPAYMQKLDTLASAIITEVNKLHRVGYGLKDRITGITPTGLDFFSGVSASTIAVTSEITSNVGSMAASIDGSSGNNDIASAIAQLRDKKVLDKNSSSLTQFYNSFVTQVGADSQRAANTASGQDLVTTQLQNQKDAVSGVSLDEEMTNLIKFQRSYDAAAKVITTASEMYDTILNMVR